MPEIICPHCKQSFSIEESGYAAIVQQIRTAEFEKEIHDRLESANAEKFSAVQLAKTETMMSVQDKINEKDKEIERLKSELANEKKSSQIKTQNAILEAVREKETELTKIREQINTVKLQKETDLSREREKTQMALSIKDEEIARLKDHKIALTTKGVGEDLEQYCLQKFNSIRMTAYPNCYFEKDNTVVEGTKGDFVFKDFADNIQYISIMFEMKNETEGTVKGHKNEDFFKKLDEDRKKKGCEYAVLVSTLEPENEFYNNGIADVSYKYPKMFVVRPQFFLPIISLLANAARSTVAYRKEIAEYRNQNIDITHFEENLQSFKTSFDRNCSLAKKKFDAAIEEIDKTIKTLTAVKENLQGSQKNLDIANDKAENLTIKKLTKNSPLLRAAFEKES